MSHWNRVVLRVSGVSRTYPGTRALDGVDFDVRGGEIHALLGGNGSGKSTLIKILAGVERADRGATIDAAGSRSLDHWSPTDAQAAGLRFVHQDRGLFPDLTVAENLALGHGFPRGVLGRIRWRSLRAHTADLLARYRVPASPTTVLSALRPVDRTRVAIVRAMQDFGGAAGGVLVLDEPTTALPAVEVDHLLDDLRRYARDGQTIIYVSHRLDEVLAVADRVTVLRDGRHAATIGATGLNENHLIDLITGRPPGTAAAAAAQPAIRVTAHADDDVVLEVAGLRGGPLRGVDLRVRRGEVLGIAGLLGSGRTELLRMLFGAYPVVAGRITLDGRRLRPRTPGAAMRAGIAYVPEDRQAEGLLPGLSVRHNLSAASIRSYHSGPLPRHGRERRDARSDLARFGIRASGDTQQVETLSGGNQQKVLLARWLRRRPRVLLLDEPTQGVDVAARQEIHALIRQARDEGTAVLLVASDPAELAQVCDRVAVLRGGRVATVVARPGDVHQLVELVNRSEETA